MFCFCESDEQRPNGGRSKFADASISRLAEDGGRSTTVIQLSKVQDKRTALEALTCTKNETKCSILFIFQLGKAKENAKLLTCCLKKTLAVHVTPNNRHLGHA